MVIEILLIFHNALHSKKVNKPLNNLWIDDQLVMDKDISSSNVVNFYNNLFNDIEGS